MKPWGDINSMPSFVHADPPLARTDYVHFTQLGINLMAEIFYNALMLEYNNYLSTKIGPIESDPGRHISF